MSHDQLAEEICSRLSIEYTDTSPLLNYRNEFELLIAVILSAQTTDAQVNRVTPELFRRYPTPDALAAGDQEEVEAVVRPTGFYRTKAHNIIACAAELTRRESGLPQTMSELTELPGVGRKTAGVILAVIHGKPAIIVDTHFGRVAWRLGLTDQKVPRKVERQIACRVSTHRWSDLSMLLNRHGRRYCTARKPKCTECPLRSLCPSAAIFADPA